MFFFSVSQSFLFGNSDPCKPRVKIRAYSGWFLYICFYKSSLSILVNIYFAISRCFITSRPTSMRQPQLHPFFFCKYSVCYPLLHLSLYVLIPKINQPLKITHPSSSLKNILKTIQIAEHNYNVQSLGQTRSWITTISSFLKGKIDL